MENLDSERPPKVLCSRLVFTEHRGDVLRDNSPSELGGE